MSKARIMIVEDEWVIADDIRMRLLESDYEVSSMAVSGEEAVRKAREDMPDLILMDINLEGKMTGIEAAGLINERIHIPHIFLTAFSDDAIIKQAAETGASGYLLKPYDTVEMNAAIEMALYKHKMEDKLKESEELFRTLVTSSASVIIYISPDHKIREFNPEAERLYGVRREEVLGKDYFKLFLPEEVRVLVEDDMKQVLSGIAIRGFENSVSTKHGQERMLSWNMQRTVNLSGEPTGVIASGHDITELRQSVVEREIIITELQDALAQVKRLSGMLPICSHCHKIRDDEGYWNQVADYITLHSEAVFSHGICPDCARKVYPDYFK